MNDLQTLFGRNLKRIRHARGLTQDALADRANRVALNPSGGLLTKHYLSRIEHGLINLTLFQCERLARAVGAPLHMLFREDGQ